MNTVVSVIISDLVSRFISFVVEKYQAHQVITDQIPRLQRLLLQASIIVEEAERRRLTNHGMLVQLKQLKEAMYRGYYVLDIAKPMASPPKRGGMVSQQCKLQIDTEHLQAVLDGMTQFLLVLMHCPPMVRQPYDAYLLMEQCMFGRHVEKQQIVNFLLRPCSSFDVLPVIGPCYVGKRTLVEHACREETVQRNFSRILRFRSDDLKNQAIDNCLTLGPSDGRFLIVVELVDDADELAWDKLYHSLRHGASGNKAILISAIDRLSDLGTVQAIRLSMLHRDENWYFFRVLAFGSANPYDHHPDLASIGRDIADELDGYFMITSIVTRLLRDNMNVQFWRRALWYIRKSIMMDVLVFGGDPKDPSRRYCPYFYSFTSDDSVIFCYNRYEVSGSMMRGDMMTSAKIAVDVLRGRHVKCGQKFDIVTQSPIPPYYYYITNCVVEKPERVHPGKKCLKRKRSQQLLSMTL